MVPPALPLCFQDFCTMSVQGASNQAQSCSALQPHRTLGRALPGEARGAVPRLVGLGWFEVGCWIQVCCGMWPPGVVTGTALPITTSPSSNRSLLPCCRVKTPAHTPSRLSCCHVAGPGHPRHRSHGCPPGQGRALPLSPPVPRLCAQHLCTRGNHLSAKPLLLCAKMQNILIHSPLLRFFSFPC